MSDESWAFVDLSIVITYIGMATFVLLAGVGGILRVVVAIPLVVVLPGYAFISMMYPDRAGDREAFDVTQTGLTNPLPPAQGLNGIERLVFAMVFSLLIVSVTAVAATATPWGVTVYPILIGVGAVTMVFALVAIIRRWRCPPEERFHVARLRQSIFFTSRWRAYASPQSVNGYNILLAVSIVLLSASAGFALANPPQGEGYTEFYVPTEPVTGETETMYQDTYTGGEPHTLTLAIGNHEGEDIEYTIVILLQQVSYDDNGVTVHETEEIADTDVSVANGEHIEHDVEFTPTMQGDDLRLLVLLYAGDAPADSSEESAHRVLRLPIEVS